MSSQKYGIVKLCGCYTKRICYFMHIVYFMLLLGLAGYIISDILYSNVILYSYI